MPGKDTTSFDETEYLRRYPDVVGAIREGKYTSGREHFERYGRAEGRSYVARPTGKSQVVFGPAKGFVAAAPSPPRHAIDTVLIAEEGWIFVLGWAHDVAEALHALQIEGRDWVARVEAGVLARMPRADVQKALGLSDARPLGFLLLIRAGGRLNPALETRVTFEWTSQKTAIVAPARTATPADMLHAVLDLLNRGTHNAPDLLIALDDGLAEQVATLNRAATAALTRNPHVQRFGPSRVSPKTSLVVCIHGRPEYVFLQGALFANRPGITDCEFIYVCNSPHLLERLCREARSAATIYGIPITIVGLPGNAGFGAANNIGVRVARARRILCLNPDVFPRHDDWAARHGAIVESGDEASRLFGAALFYDDGALMHGGMYFELDTMLSVRPGFVQSAVFARVEHHGKGAPPDTPALLCRRPVPAVSGAFLSIDRAWFEKLGGFAEDFVFGHYEDADLCLRSLEAGVPAWLQEVSMWHLEGQGSTPHAQMGGASLVNRALFSRRWRALIADLGLGADAVPAPGAIKQAAE